MTGDEYGDGDIIEQRIAQVPAFAQIGCGLVNRGAKAAHRRRPRACWQSSVRPRGTKRPGRSSRLARVRRLMDIVRRMQTETCCAQIGSAHIGESGYADALCSKELVRPLPTALLAHPADADTAEESVHSRIHRAVDQGLSSFECFGDTVGAFKVVCENLPRQPLRCAVQSDREALSGA